MMRNPYQGIPLPPGASLAPGGVGVAGRILATKTTAPQILFAGWLHSDSEWVPSQPWMRLVETLALHPVAPVDAPAAPDDSSVWTQIVKMPRWGWLGGER